MRVFRTDKVVFSFFLCSMNLNFYNNNNVSLQKPKYFLYILYFFYLNIYQLFTKPRCGVPDIEGQPYYLRQQPAIAKNASHKSRTKRFIFGAKTWTKRNIKYL